MHPWQQAQTDLTLRQLLEASLADPKIAKLLMLHRDELFPRFDLDDQGRFTVGASGFPLMSHPVKIMRRSVARQVSKAIHFSTAHPRIETASELQSALDSSLGPDLLAHLGLGILRLIREQEILRALVAQSEEVTLNDVRRTTGRLPPGALDALISSLKSFGGQVADSNPRRAAVRSLSINLDLFRDATDLETGQLQILNMMIQRYDALRKEIDINQADWQKCAIWLHQLGFLENAGPILVWCPDCPETGVSASVRSSFVRSRYYCPACRRVSYAALAFYPAREFKSILETQDGLIHASVGWQLAKYEMEPQPNVGIGKFEVDFYCQPTSLLVECKMNHRIGSKDRLLSKLRSNLKQLRDHVEEALAMQLPITHAIAVVNSPASELASAITNGLTATQSVGGVELSVLSYQDLAAYLVNRRRP